MLYRMALRRLIASVLALFLFVMSSAIQAASTPAFWVATKGISKVYLFGSMHFGRQDFYPLPDVVERAFTASSTLVVEVNLLDLGADAQQVIFRHAGLPNNQSLADIISPETYSALTAQASRNQIPVTAFNRFQPWYVTLTLVEAEIRKTDLRQQLGLDLYFLKRAAAVRKPVEELETFDAQLALFSSIAFEDQERFLRQTLADLQSSRGYLKVAADAWLSGDLGMLDKSLIEPFRTQEETTQLFDKMFTQRNVKMAKAIMDYFEEGESVFVVVGVGHMLGDDGVIRLLRSQGIDVRRLSVGHLTSDSSLESPEPGSQETGLP